MFVPFVGATLPDTLPEPRMGDPPSEQGSRPESRGSTPSPLLSGHPRRVGWRGIATWSVPAAAITCGLLLALVFLIDVTTGPLVHFSLYYFLPIIVASLRFLAPWGLAVALTSAVLACAPLPGSEGLTLWVVITNTITEAVVFSLVALVTGALQRQGQRLRHQREELADAYAVVQRDLRAAELLQSHLLRRPVPAIPGIEVAVDIRFARGVGGDFYDLRCVGRHLALCIADVSGKGAQAALISAALRAHLDELGGQLPSPGVFLSHLNQRLHRALPDDMFVTLFYGQLDPETGELRYASAGHDPPLLCRGQSLEALPPTAPVLGMLPEVSQRVIVGAGELLLLYTDGLTTARDEDGQRIGEERVAAYLQERRAVSPAGLLEELMNLASPGGQTLLEDDVAVIVLRRHEAVRKRLDTKQFDSAWR
jgi:serine phosphatase RsbU (regulator of sigma subunit)